MVYVANAFYADPSYLEHDGVLGMKWGVRRWQNKDGTLTEAGKRRAAQLAKKQEYYAARSGKYAKKYERLTMSQSKEKETKADESKSASKSTDSNKSTTSKPAAKKSVFEMSDDELKSEVNRLDLIKKYNGYMKEIYGSGNKDSKQKKRLINGRQIVGDIITKSLTEVGTQYAKKNLRNLLKLENTNEGGKKKKKNN